MKKPKRLERGIAANKLRNQLLVLFMLMSLMVLTVSSLFYYFQTLNILQQRNEQSTIQTFRQAEYSIQSFLKEVDKISLVFITQSSTKQFLEQRKRLEPEMAIETVNVLSDLTLLMQNYKYLDSIYLLTNDGRRLGLRQNLTRSSSELKPVLPLAFTTKVKAAFPRLIWMGGTTLEDLEVDVPADIAEVRYFSALRGVKSVEQSVQSGVMVINIRESFIAGIYSAALSDHDSLVYIVDDKGIVISHPDMSQLGKMVPIFGELKANLDYDSFRTKISKVEKQIVYYKMKGTNWIFVKEVPLDVLRADGSKLRLIILYILLICCAVAFLLSSYWVRRVTHPISDLIYAMRDLKRGNLGVTVSAIPDNELAVLSTEFNRMSLSIQDLVEQNKAIEEEKRKIEIRMLQGQISPHFLYNTLNSIKWMAAVMKANNIVKGLTALGNLLRPIYKNFSSLASVREEMDYLQNYIMIMNFRYGEGINVQFHVDEEVQSLQMLRFILQPLIENSIIHGMESRNHMGHIDVYAHKAGHELHITIKDDGCGVSAIHLKELRNRINDHSSLDETDGSFGIGLRNVNQRLKLHYGQQCGLELTSKEGEGMEIHIYMLCDPNEMSGIINKT